MPVSAEIARTLMPAASSGATLARLVSCLTHARGDAELARCRCSYELYRKSEARSGTLYQCKWFGGDLGGEWRAALEMSRVAMLRDPRTLRC